MSRSRSYVLCSQFTSFLCFGRSLRMERAANSAILAVPHRRSSQLAFHGISSKGATGNAEATLRLYGGGTARDTLLSQQPAPKPFSPEEPAPAPYGAPAVAGPAPAAPKFNLHQLRLKHAREQPISMVTAYDYPSARIADGAGVDMLLVGDSVGMVVLGRKDTTEVTMDEMVHHCRAAATGTSRALLVGDLPFGSYLTAEDAARNGVRLVKEGRADAVKLEGGGRVVPQVRSLVDAGVAVMGHIGLTPQSYAALGGYRVQGRTGAEAARLFEDALALQAAGCFAIVLEMVPAEVAQRITSLLAIPTIGIGAGGGTSGQVQVFHDLLGLYDQKVPKFVRQFSKLEQPMRDALAQYVHAVDARAFPQPRHTFPISHEHLGDFCRRVGLPPPQTPPPPPPVANNVVAEGLRDGAAPIVEAHAVSISTNGLTPTNTAAAASTPGRAAVALAGVGADGRTAPQVVGTIAEWRALQARGVVPRGALGFVPTMGALHEGHLSLVRLAREWHERVAVSIFVNPKQFAAHEDLGKYPRTFEADLEALSRAGGVDFVFAPCAEEMYPRGPRGARLAPFVDLEGADVVGEGAARPGFFRGVATVVTKLLNITQPRAMYLGQKDGMQCIVLQRLVRDLDFDVEVVVGPTVRAPDGLALSSRNVYLSAEERAAAPAVYAALTAVADAYAQGERSAARLRARAAAVIGAQPLMALDYLSLASMQDGQELEGLLGGSTGGEDAAGVLAAIAVRLGNTRLIDNVVLA